MATTISARINLNFSEEQCALKPHPLRSQGNIPQTFFPIQLNYPTISIPPSLSLSLSLSFSLNDFYSLFDYHYIISLSLSLSLSSLEVAGTLNSCSVADQLLTSTILEKIKRKKNKHESLRKKTLALVTVFLYPSLLPPPPPSLEVLENR